MRHIDPHEAMRFGPNCALIAVAGLLLCCAVWAQPNQVRVEGAHYAMTQLPPMRFRAEGYDYDKWVYANEAAKLEAPLY